MIGNNILQGVPNFRDIGGMETADGRRIRPHRLLRGGHLADLTEQDRERLAGEFGLRIVVDLRTTGERSRKPDQVLPGVTYLHCPIFDNPAEGVTREEQIPADPVRSAMEMARHMEGQARERMIGLYSMFFEEHGIAHFREFFRVLLAQEEGAVLWHCTMGKDRCGTAAVLLETALGVPMETVLADYLYTNERVRPLTEDIIARARLLTDDEALFEQMRIMDSADTAFLNAALDKAAAISGSLDAFLTEQLDLTPANRARLRELYLE